jgi:hypothetical protein
MKRIKFFSDFCSDQQIYNNMMSCFKLNESPHYGIKYVLTDGDDYTHAVIINLATPSLVSNVPKENVVGLAYEPPVFLNLTQNFINYAENNISKYYIGENDSLNTSIFIEKYSYMCYDSSLPTKIKPKIKPMSIIFSHKQYTTGHKYRHKLIQNILNSSLPIDIYGNGCRLLNHIKDRRIKGEFNGSEPYSEYMFHITIENVSIPEYFSEKILNALVSKCVPIYWGCKNIDNYFPKKTYKLTGVLSEDMNLLTRICKKPELYYNKININVDEINDSVNIEKLLLEM